MAEQLHVIIHGYVQGVGYRVFAVREGRRLGLSGTVRNQADGAVEVIAEGERPALEEFLKALRRGPSEAEVRRVDERWGATQTRFVGFDIGY